MAIWRRTYTDKRTYFDKDTGLIRKQDSKLTIHVFGISMLKRTMNFDAEVDKKEEGIGFKNQ